MSQDAHTNGRAALSVLREGLPREAFDLALNRFFEATWAANPEFQLACRPGCAHCCEQWIFDVHPHEIARLLPHARPFAAELQERLAHYEALKAEHPDPEAAALAYWRCALPCVFLSPAGECRVYAERPYACRRFFSQAVCSPQSAEAGKAQSLMLEPDPDVDVWLTTYDEGLDAKRSGELIRDLVWALQ